MICDTGDERLLFVVRHSLYLLFLALDLFRRANG